MSIKVNICVRATRKLPPILCFLCVPLGAVFFAWKRQTAIEVLQCVHTRI